MSQPKENSKLQPKSSSLIHYLSLGTELKEETKKEDISKSGSGNQIESTQDDEKHSFQQLFFVNRGEEVIDLTKTYLDNYKYGLVIENGNITEERNIKFVVATQMFGSGKTR